MSMSMYESTVPMRFDGSEKDLDLPPKKAGDLVLGVQTQFIT